MDSDATGRKSHPIIGSLVSTSIENQPELLSHDSSYGQSHGSKGIHFHQQQRPTNQKNLQQYQQQEEKHQREHKTLSVPQFPYQQQKQQFGDYTLNEQQFPNLFSQMDQQNHLQVSCPNKEFHQENQKNEVQHWKQSGEHERQQQQHSQQQQLQNQKFSGNEDEKRHHEMEQAQHCALEIFTSISQHVGNAASDFNVKRKDVEKIDDLHAVGSNLTSISLRRDLSVEEIQQPIVHPKVLPHHSVPAFACEGLRTDIDDSAVSVAKKGQDLNVSNREEDTKNSKHEVTTIEGMTKDGTIQSSDNHPVYSEFNKGEMENVANIKREISDQNEITIRALSYDFTYNTARREEKDSVYHDSKSLETKKANGHGRSAAEIETNDKDFGKAINEEEENTKDEIGHQICPCKEDFHKHTQNKLKKYICGGCLSKFISICHLHKHLENHGSGGSYHFDHISQTAFPKYDTFCSFTQTDDFHFPDQDDPNSLEEGNRSDKEISSKTFEEQNITQTDFREQKLQVSGTNRKRKQDNPKPRLSDHRKGERNKKGSQKKRTERKDDENPEHYITNAHSIDTRTNCVVGDFDIAFISKTNFVSNVSAENNCLIVKQEVLDENETVSKPFKKRGRPRKPDSAGGKSLKKKKKLVTTNVKNKSIKTKDVNESMDEYVNDTQDIDHEEEMMDTLENSEDNPKVKHKRRKNASKHQQCDVCGLPVPKYNYVYHMRLHTGEKPYVCDKCGKAFAHRRFLFKHMLTHAEDKPFKCELCSAQFCQKSEYNMHMNSHEGNRPHECRVCGMKFLSKGMLNTHQANVHMGITRFECEVCNRRFFKRSSLNCHKATHFEATMKCSVCDRMFKDKAGLKRHERIHTGENRFRCHVCNHEFIQSTPYWVHMEKNHQMNRESVKNMLKGIRESNKRIGKRTEINVLPKDVDHLLISQEKTEAINDKITKDLKKIKSETSEEKSTSTKTASKIDNILPIPAFEQLSSAANVVPHKTYTDIIVPNIYSSSVPNLVLSNTFTSMENNEQLPLQQHYRYISQEPVIVHAATCGPGSISTQESTMGCSQPLTLQPYQSIPASLASLNIPMNSLNHGLIGMNPLQQAHDYTSSLPSTGTYTDISSERVTSQQH